MTPSDLNVFTTISNMIKTMSWSAMPLFLSIALPFYYALLKGAFSTANIDLKSDETTVFTMLYHRLNNFFVIFFKEISKEQVILVSLIVFTIGIVILKIDQGKTEEIRKDGLRIKEYMIQNNQLSITKEQLLEKDNGLSGLCVKSLNKVLVNYPNDFIQVGTNIILVEPILDTNSTANKLPSEQQKIYTFSVKLLERYLSSEKIKTDSSMTFETLQKINNRFTQEIIYRLITNDTIKYNYAKDSHNNELIIKRK